MTKSVLDVRIDIAPGDEPPTFDRETAMVATMHRRFDLGVSHTPRLLSPAKMQERIECLTEELMEMMDAFAKNDLDGVADALIDLTVFAKGTAVLMGLPWAELFDDVMRANMAKVRGVGKRGHKVDLVKPAGWQGPRTWEILRDYIDDDDGGVENPVGAPYHNEES